jgi:hypothetical protein
MTTASDLDGLEAVAEAANNGPWDVRKSVHCDGSWVVEDGEVIAAFTEVFPECAIAMADVDAAHIAAFDPPTAKALIARCRRSELALSHMIAAAEQIVEAFSHRIYNGDGRRFQQIMVELREKLGLPAE